MSSTEREELLSQVDFSRVNEETIAACKSNKLIPQQLITDAALALCVKLRKQLEDTQNRLHLIEIQSGKSRSTYPSSSSIISFFLSEEFISIFYLEYRSNILNSSFRSPPRSRTTYTNPYDTLRSYSILNSSKYDQENDLDYILPSRYVSSALNSRYGSYSSPYRY